MLPILCYHDLCQVGCARLAGQKIIIKTCFFVFGGSHGVLLSPGFPRVPCVVGLLYLLHCTPDLPTNASATKLGSIPQGTKQYALQFQQGINLLVLFKRNSSKSISKETTVNSTRYKTILSTNLPSYSFSLILK